MALQYLFDPNKQFQSRNGVNAVNGFLRVYLNGTDDRATTYRNFDGGLNEPDIVLDTDGRAVVIVDDTKTYRLEVYSPTGAPQWTVENYKVRGGSGGSGTPVSVEGTAGEIDVYENTVDGVKHFIVSLAENVKNAISSLTSAVNGLALTLGNKKERQTPKEFFGSTTKTVVGVSQDENGEMSATFDDIAFPDWTSAINEAVSVCEKTSNKKNTLTGYESSTTAYPSIKAVVDFVNAAMQNLGGKLITDNGDPFASSSALPTTTPYQGVDIADKDYAYIQGVGTAERWSATVSGTSVSWLQEYAISIPVFTPAQQAAIDSGVTAEMLGTFLTKTGDGSNVTATFTAAGSRTNISTGEKLSVIFGKIAKWFSDLKALAFKDNVSDSDISGTIADVHIASASIWNAKQSALPYSNGKYGINISGNADSATTAQTANYATEAEKVSKTVGTYGQDGYRGIFAGYNSTGGTEGVVVQLADKRSGTSSATEITPQGMVTSGSVTATGGFHGNADSATTAQSAQEANRSATADIATLAASLSDSKGTPGQTGYKNIFAGYNNSTSEYGIGIAKKESGGDKATEITADGISTTGQITAGGGFVGNLTGNATSATYATYDSEGRLISSYYKGLFQTITPISKTLETASSGAFQQLSPTLSSYLPYKFDRTLYFVVINFVQMDFGAYDFSQVELQLRNKADTSQSQYGALLGSVGIIVPKGNTTFSLPIPFDLSGISGQYSFAPALYGSFGSVIFGGSVNGTHFYYTLQSYS